MLSVSALHGGYGRIPILNNISFEVSTGEFVGIFGHNGMGKTTLLRVLAGQLPATAGSIVLDGRDITRLAPHAPGPPRPRLRAAGPADLSAAYRAENLRMGAIGAGRGEDEIERCSRFFRGCNELRGHIGGVLSGGEQQILAIARCLCGEPTTCFSTSQPRASNPPSSKRSIEILVTLRDKNRVTVVLVEQSLDFICRLASRILIIQKGMIIRSMRTEQLDYCRRRVLRHAFQRSSMHKT